MSKILIRPARATDKPAVEIVCAQAWENGEDYIPGVWDEWLADPYGQLVVAEFEGQVAALGKLTRLADDGSTELAEVEWWLEGLRVHPDYRQQGIARQLQTYLVERARQIGQGTLRYGTHSLNEPVHRIATRLGLRHVSAYRLYRADSLPAGASPSLRQLAEADLPAAWALVSESPRHRAAAGLYETFWTWKNLTSERLARHLAAGEVWGLGAGAGLTGLALVYTAEGEDALDVGYVDGAEETLGEILSGVRGLAARVGCNAACREPGRTVRFKPVDEPALVAAVEVAGYERSWDRDIWIFELRLE